MTGHDYGRAMEGGFKAMLVIGAAVGIAASMAGVAIVAGIVWLVRHLEWAS